MTEKKIAETKAAMEKQIAEINASYANSKKAIDDKIALDKATAETAVKMAGEDKRLAEYKVLDSIHMGVNKKIQPSSHAYIPTIHALLGHCG